MRDFHTAIHEIGHTAAGMIYGRRVDGIQLGSQSYCLVHPYAKDYSGRHVLADACIDMGGYAAVKLLLGQEPPPIDLSQGDDAHLKADLDRIEESDLGTFEEWREFILECAMDDLRHWTGTLEQAAKRLREEIYWSSARVLDYLSRLRGAAGTVNSPSIKGRIVERFNGQVRPDPAPVHLGYYERASAGFGANGFDDKDEKAIRAARVQAAYERSLRGGDEAARVARVQAEHEAWHAAR